MKADKAVQASQDKLDMLTARYDVRRGELDAAGNEFIGAIDAQKNVLTLEEARRRLSSSSRTPGRDGDDRRRARRVVEERRNKAQMAMERAQGIIDNLVVKAPIDGVISVKENRDGQFFFFSGMVLPQYREGDTTFSGRNIADIVESGKMEVRAKVTETDRDNLQGRASRRRCRSTRCPAATFTAKVGALSGGASRGNFFETARSASSTSPSSSISSIRGMRAGSSLRVVIDGEELVARCTCRGRRSSRRTARTSSSSRSASASIAAT